MDTHKSQAIRRYVSFDRIGSCRLGGVCILAAGLMLAGQSKPASALPLASGRWNLEQPKTLVELVQRRGGARVRTGVVARGPRGGVVAGGRVTTVRPGYRPIVRPVRPVVVAPGWRRPGNYWWRPGAAVAAGAAIGFVSAAAAASWAGSPPAPGYCWYYTDASRTKGFWDVCP